MRKTLCGTAVTWAIVSLVLLAANPAAASCGAAFCSVNTDWATQGAWHGAGSRLDLRYEFVQQDQLMSGSDQISTGQISRHDDEVSTYNRNLVLAYSYNTQAGWGINVQLPWVSRSHYHIHNHHDGEKTAERWRINEAGDARVTLRMPLGEQKNLDMLVGVKLPTGRTTVANNDNDIAERTLQPGTGSTDTLLGFAYRAPSSGPHGWFAQAMWQHAAAVRNSYRPGDQVSIDAGWRYAFNADVSATVQANWQYRARDEGRNAEPADSGSRMLNLSPGVVYALDHETQVHAFVQLPVYVHVNGVQLTNGRNVTLGISRRF